MSGYIGDRLPGDVINFKFMTYTTGGVPLSMTSVTISAFKDDNTAESAAGITTTVQFDGRAGAHHVRITTATDAAFYSAGSDYACCITAQSPATPNMLGAVVGEFSIANRVPNLAQGEPGQGAPPASTSMATKLAYLYKALRNKKTQTATGWNLFADNDTTVDQKTTVSDDGTTATKGKLATGP